jgi:ketosteroid isomerase-like protein
MKRTMLALLAVAFVVLFPAPAPAQGMGDSEMQVAQAAEGFVDAFNDLDWDRFEEAWAEDATAFMPMPEFPARLNGRDTIVATFRSVFADVPDRFEGPPYLTIDPVDLRIAVMGTAAVVTFHLGDEAPRSRRTLVFVQQGGAWRIAHLHASGPPS